jgi:cysteine sulfinate desulfinase/cysteine desulfurase-like protein
MVILPAATVSLANEAIAASAGPVLPAPAASKNPDPSYVFRAMEVPQTAIHGPIRFFLGRYNIKRRSITSLRKSPHHPAAS